jgi:hypothetical protein
MALDPADGYPYTPPEIAMAAGNQKLQAHQFAVDIDIAMRRHYAGNLQVLAKTLYPILYAEATFNGGRYTFCEDEHTTYVFEEINHLYTELKAIAHTPLAIYSIIFPYAEYSENSQWEDALSAFRVQVDAVSKRVDQLDIPVLIRPSSTRIMEAAKSFIDTLLINHKFSVQEYTAFCSSIGSDILVNQTAAAVEQVAAMRAKLQAWRASVGQATWDKMYVVLQCIWTVSQESAHEQIIKSEMKPEFHETNIIVSEAAPTLDDARLLLARILADRVLAAAVFGTQTAEAYKQNIYSLSTKRDLLAKAVESELGGGAAAACPYLKPTKPTKPSKPRKSTKPKTPQKSQKSVGSRQKERE